MHFMELALSSLKIHVIFMFYLLSHNVFIQWFYFPFILIFSFPTFLRNYFFPFKIALFLNFLPPRWWVDSMYSSVCNGKKSYKLKLNHCFSLSSSAWTTARLSLRWAKPVIIRRQDLHF